MTTATSKYRLACCGWVGVSKTQPSHTTSKAKLIQKPQKHNYQIGQCVVEVSRGSTLWSPRQHWLSGRLSIFTLEGIPHRVSWNCRCYLRQIPSTSPNLTPSNLTNTLATFLSGLLVDRNSLNSLMFKKCFAKLASSDNAVFCMKAKSVAFLRTSVGIRIQLCRRIEIKGAL